MALLEFWPAVAVVVVAREQPATLGRQMLRRAMAAQAPLHPYLAHR